MNYQIRNLGYRTDFIFNKLDGSVVDKGEYIVATTESNPNFFWGNLLLFKRPPEKGDFLDWNKKFKEEFRNPVIYHITFAWDSLNGEEGNSVEFINNGFELDKAIVLTTHDVIRPRKYNKIVKIRTINLSQYLEACINIQVACAHDHLSKESWRNFYTSSMKKYYNLINDGHGRWFGAFIGKELVGTLGIFKDNDVGRFQIVSTHPSFQRSGVCSTLVYESAQYAINEMGIKMLVMVADENYHAAKIYESVGFIPTQKQTGMCWWDKERYS
jgi:ribosomal protein S18 acetylase RimI-like enzyme